MVFLDWEKPRRVVARGHEANAPVSCWRQLLLANEWNELQTVRLTNPSFTLFVIVLVRCNGSIGYFGDDSFNSLLKLC